MVTGYSFPHPSSVDGYDSLRAGFEWDVPTTYNIAEAVFETADDEDPALYHVSQDGTSHVFTYGEIEAASDRLAATLDREGVGSGDRIVLCLPQCPEMLIVHLAAFKLGAVTVPVSIVLGEDSFRRTVESTDAASVWLDDVAADRFSAALDDGDESAHVVEVTATSHDERSEGGDRALGGLRQFVTDASIDATAVTEPSDDALIVFTSGSSGKPKGVVQGHQYLLGVLPAYQLWFHLFEDSHDERVWTPADWAWAGALFDVVYPTLAMGGTVCSRVRRSGFDPVAALNFIERSEASRLFFPATALRRILNQADVSQFDLDAVSVVLCGGEYLAADHRESSERALDATINVSYGTTEANALIGNCQQLFPVRDDSIGLPYPGHEIRIVDEDGTPVEHGEVGEIALSLPDPVVFNGYWNDEKATSERFAGDDTFLPGDLAYRDDDGYVYYVGREDAVILSSGYRVHPDEVEQTLEAADGVSTAVVDGVEDDDVGNRIVAYLVLDGGAPDAVEDLELRQFVKDRLGMHKAPHEFHVIESVPETHSGKVDREALFSE